MISKEKELFDKLLEVYNNALCDVQALSYNDSGDRDFIISDFVGFNFDKVLNCSNIYKKQIKEKSPDALFYSNNKLYFIEFKEGKSHKEDIRLKIHEGITTLYHFIRKYLPAMTREEFISLDFNYAVVCRGDGSKSALSREMLSALENSSQKYSLKNLEGFIIKRTAVIDDPHQILRFLNRISSGKVTSIKIFEHLGTTQQFDMSA
ncbi:hypothetical protein [Pantoea hericii]|uniref:hypothetical protein n=1 Tax=Pantoea hericii TaxID=1815628 RepID=UPI0015FA936A|nr:hypothetical protein [Pantoea hericii]